MPVVEGARRSRSIAVTTGLNFEPENASGFTPTFTPDQNVGTALRHTFRAFADAVNANLEPLGLTLNMWFVLRALWETDGQQQVALARKLTVTPAAMVGILNSLETAGLVERRRSPNDGRAYRVFLTKQGQAVRTRATRRVLQVDAKALNGITLEETRVLLALLAKLRGNIEHR